jgi:large subunit ribosomal protein L9
MKVILKQEVTDLGQPGQIFDVAAGYARNYLLPRGLALPATPQNLKIFEQQRHSIEIKSAKSKQDAEGLANQLKGIRCTIEAKAGDQDRLFGSVTSQDIAEYLEKEGFQMEKKRILMDGPIRSLGEHVVLIRLHPEVKAHLKVSIIREAP